MSFITLQFKNAPTTGDGTFALQDGLYSISAFGAFIFSGGPFSLSTISLNTVQFGLTPGSDTVVGQVQLAVAATPGQDPSVTMNGFADDSVTLSWPVYIGGGTRKADLMQGQSVQLVGYAPPSTPGSANADL